MAGNDHLVEEFAGLVLLDLLAADGRDDVAARPAAEPTLDVGPM
jgi:hypothetical protein